MMIFIYHSRLVKSTYPQRDFSTRYEKSPWKIF